MPVFNKNPSRKSLKGKNKGFSLVELLITIFILSLGTISTLLFFITVLHSTQYGSDLTTATSHVESIFEEMKTRTTLADIANTDWPSWAQSQGFVTLPSETITAAIVNPSADPLVIHTTASWIRNARQNSVILSTEITK